jgi:tetratricopeptide (TPR) repeat protein
MEWVSTIVVLMAVALVMLQGYLLLVRSERKPHARFGGIVNLLLAVSALTAFLLFSAGALILSPEYGVILVQGTGAWIWACIFIVGLSIGMGLALHAARCAKSLPDRLYRLLVAASIVCLAAVARMSALNSSDPAPFRIRCYDLWWPILMVWIVVCLSDWISINIGIRSRTTRVCGAALFTTGLALLAVYRAQTLHFRYADRISLGAWRAVGLVSVPIVMALGTRIAITAQRTEAGRIKRIVIPALAGIVGLMSAAIWILGASVVTPWIVWATWIFAIVIVGARRLYGSFRAGTLQVPDIGRPGRMDDGVSLIALFVIVASLVDISHSGRLDPRWDLAALILSWIVLLEIIAGSPLWTLHRAAIDRVLNAEAPLRALTLAVGRTCRTVASRTAQSFKAAFKVDSLPTAILKVVVLVICLIAIAEIPNAGKTIVQPFEGVGLSDKDKDRGRAVSDRIVNTLGLIKQELQPELIVVSTGLKDEKNISMGAAGEEGSLQAAVKGSNVEIPGTKITLPVGFLAAPIQAPLRHLLGVRIINGSVQKSKDGYILLANSSDGKTWRAEAKPSLRLQSSSAAAVNPGGNEMESATPVVSDADGGEIQELADELAYQIISSDELLTRVGMTSSWHAIPDFRKGLVAWNSFLSTEDFDDLSEAIKNFRLAIQADRNFALAYYRLGLALTRDGQPGAAVASLRASLQANPKFVKAQIALADTLYYFDQYYFPLPAALSTTMPYSDTEKGITKDEARKLFQQVIRERSHEATMSDRAAAYAGLCRGGYGVVPQGGGPELSAQYMEFFYCKRAEYLYSKLPVALRTENDIKAAEGWLLNEIGVILDDSAPKDRQSAASNSKEQGTPWSCGITASNVNQAGVIESESFVRNTYTRSALKYYQQALLVQPEDPSIRCNAASDSSALGDAAPMTNLAKDAGAHMSVGDGLLNEAKTSADAARAGRLYRAVLAEYDKAIDLAPSNIEALNNYAYAFWNWRLNWPDKKPPDGPEATMAHQAEKYARRATLLASNSGSRSLHTQVQSTLGEVLLAQARPEEAINILEGVVLPAKRGEGNEIASKTEVPDHPLFNEVRWDLAEAYVCANANALHSHAENYDLVAKAVTLLDRIRDTEQDREDGPFTREPDRLDASRARRVCQWLPETAIEREPDRNGPEYDMQQTESAHPPCNWVGVLADAVDGAGKAMNGEDDGLYLHVWGLGVDRTIPVGDEPRMDVVLSSKPTDSQRHYFAQLERKGKDEKSELHAASIVYPVRTYANQGTPCDKNLIQLTFKPKLK